MDFSLSEEQVLLKAGADRFVREHYNFEARRALAAGSEGFSRDHWRLMAELGWLALPFAEEDEGLGGSAADVMLLMDAIGHGLVLEPYFSTILLAGALIAELGDGAQKADALTPLLTGERLAAFAFAEPKGRYDLADVETTAEADGPGYRISGEKCVVLGAGAADILVVLARTSGSRRDACGLSCFLVESAAGGIDIRSYRTTDGGRAAEITFTDVRVDRSALLGAEDAALPSVEAVIDRACAALAAEAVGIMEAATEATRIHLQTREQFGRPLAAFQALQHRLADMTIACEETRSLMMVANLRADDPDILERARAVSAVKAEIGRAGNFVVANAVQLHGGMGVSEELVIASYFKRLHMINAMLGDRAFHLRRYAALAA